MTRAVPQRIDSVAAVLRHLAQERPDEPLLRVARPDWITATQLDQRTSALAAGLARLGVQRGDRIATILPNRPEVIEVLFAAAKLGAIQVPLNYWLKGEFLRHQLADCEPRVLVADVEGVKSAIELLDPKHTDVVVAVDDVESSGPIPITPYATVVDTDPAELRTIEEAPGATLSILYTSGTTGMPKGCLLSSAYYVSIGRRYGQAGWVVPGDRIHTAFPLFHTSGQLLTLMSALVNGASVSYDSEFHASTFMADAAACRATVVSGVGFMANAILAQPEKPEDGASGLRMAMWIPLSEASQLHFERRFGTRVMTEAFGQTEVFPVSISTLDGPRKRDSAGQVTPEIEVRIVDEDDREVPNGVAGEIVVRPREQHAMFQGYWRNPAATAETWRGLWHHTGDTAIRDDRGFLTFVDRKKDAMRRRGENVSSYQLELAIGEHACIDAVAVCAVPSPLGEDEIKASIVLAEGADLDASELFEFLRSNVPYYAIPRYVDIRVSLPVNGVGRVMKQALRDEGIRDDMIDFEAIGLVVPRNERRSAAPGRV